MKPLMIGRGGALRALLLLTAPSHLALAQDDDKPEARGAFTGDGVCEVSRGEASANSSDCLLTCGNGVADPGENLHELPGDVRLFPGDSQLAQRATPY